MIPIHLHRTSSENVVVLRRKIRREFYEDLGNETERVALDANGKNRFL